MASQVAGEMPTLISLVASGAGDLPATGICGEEQQSGCCSCRVLDKIPISEIALVWRKKAAPSVIEQSKKFVLANAS
ncbi:MAG: hypothetical protein JO331_08885 [Verrucomicrobia bacterium]|nr:hypothetical protein [Verrucomicrobiota bacterium]